MDDQELKREMMSDMMADLIDLAEDPGTAQAIADHLIRKGWRKQGATRGSMFKVTYPQPEWQCCPVCFGRGLVACNFYNFAEAGSSASPVECKSCQGKGIIQRPVTVSES